MKRLFLIVMVLVVAAGAGFSQNLTVLDDDFNIFLGSLGEHLLPHLQQTAVNGISTGDASVPAYRTFTIGTSVGAVLDLKGWDEAIAFPDDYEALLPLDDIVNDAIAGVGAPVTTLYEGFIPYPVSRLTLGGTIAGWQILGTAAWVPNALADAALGFAGDAAESFSGLEFSILNLGGQVRRTLVEDQPGFPAITAGLGYTYGGFNLSVPLPADIETLLEEQVEGATASAENLFVDTTVHTAGLELAISKKLAFFVPFIAVTPYFQQSTFQAGIENFNLTVGDTSYDEQSGNGDPGATVNVYDFALAARGGFDLVFGGFGLFLHGQYSLSTMAPAVTTGMRLSF
ncbi:MAG: hypothetical protein ACLFO1_00635 [Spirochaetaceae bacterium]